MSRVTSLKPLLALIALACFAMLGAALLLQHLAAWEPCTLCIQIRLWLLCGGVVSLLMLALEALGLRWLTLALWPLLLAAAGMAVYDNTQLVLIETGVLQSSSCSPFPFYAFYLPLHDWLPSVFMSAGVCGQNDYQWLGLSFTTWTLAGVSALLGLVLLATWRSLRPARG
ncbi:disulfide bond formation protein B [Pseudomonas sp.]|uniref:disulfide bond formation protein B n=1 Tax=Pseudomonas sp. TaxID=306 RepID=UPI003BB5B53F